MLDDLEREPGIDPEREPIPAAAEAKELMTTARPMRKRRTSVQTNSG
ncbi:MAG: hypothetical protein ACXVAF_17300 [Vulcanimicrobiaceae bacterium]